LRKLRENTFKQNFILLRSPRQHPYELGMAFTYILPYLQEIDDMELRPRCRRKSLESGKQKETQRSLKSKQKNKA